MAFGVIHKPHRQLRGRAVSQMSSLLYKPYIVKWSTKEEGGLKKSKKLSIVRFVPLVIDHNPGYKS